MIKGSIQEEDIKIVNIYAPNIGAPQYIRQMLTAIKGEINSNKPKTIKKMVIGTYVSIIILNVKGLNAPNKRHRLAK